jgi:hypothetical protein
VAEGIGLFLTPDLPREDLWQMVDSRLLQALRQHPDVERRLMGSPLDSLAPADQFFRGMVLEERGRFAEAVTAFEAAIPGLYTAEYLQCHAAQLEYVAQQVSSQKQPVIDLASGRCQLVEKLARQGIQPIVATDFSPRVLRQDRRRLDFLGLYANVSLLAFDARRTPFREGSIEILTTNLGLSNIEQPGALVRELRRILGGAFSAVCHFFPEEDVANRQTIERLGLSPFLYRRSALAQFEPPLWHVGVANARFGKARPTSPGQLLEGAGIDALPAAETVLQWCVLLAR